MSWFSSLFGQRPTTASAAPLYVTNTLSGKKEIFAPIKAGTVSLYSCGPTVYSRAQIGNMRAYIFADTLARMLKQSGLHVRRVINITDVGHLVSDADEGEDKMLVGAKREGITAEQVADRCTKLFLDDLRTLNVDTDDIAFPRATEYLKEQIAMIQTLEEKGFTYRTHDGIYFDTSRFADYGKLGAGADTQTKEYALADIGRRITENKEKRHPADFALWRFSPHTTERLQEWESPWGKGFPGWHIECSAMTKALLGTQIDLHTGGIDHIPVHHNNEIAQSEAVSGKQFVKYWMHLAFLSMDGVKISKSLGNDVYVSDLETHGLHPLALRYFFLQAHYRSALSFTWEAVTAANEALHRLWRLAGEICEESGGKSKPSAASRTIVALVRDDLATPAALALLWETVKDDSLPAPVRLGALEAAEPLFGLRLTNPPEETRTLTLSELPEEYQALAREREEARTARDFATADRLRIHLEHGGYLVEDGPSGPLFTRKP